MRFPAPNALVGGTLIGFLGIVAAVSAVWTPYDPLRLSFRAKLAAPSAAHWRSRSRSAR